MQMEKTGKVSIILAIIVAIMSLAMVFSQISVNKKRQEVHDEELKYAYQQGTVITLAEENILAMYAKNAVEITKLRPLRQAWLDNPSEETAEQYIQAMLQLLEPSPSEE